MPIAYLGFSVEFHGLYRLPEGIEPVTWDDAKEMREKLREFAKTLHPAYPHLFLESDVEVDLDWSAGEPD